MKISACIDMMFSHLDFYEKFSAVKKCGLDAVEFWKWTNKDISKVKEELKRNNLKFGVFNIDSKDEELSFQLSRGILNKGMVDEFLSALEESIPVYKELGASGMIVLIGETLEIPYEEQIDNIKKCLKAAKPIVEKENVNLVVEPLNDIDRKNYFLPRSKEVFEILREINSPNIKLLFDIYHEQLMAGNIINSIKENIDLIGHFHVADVPGRHEPGTGELNYPNIIRAINETNYNDFIGLEYRATKPDENTFNFLKEI